MTKKANGVVSAKHNPQGKQEGNPTEGLTYEEFGRNNGSRMVVDEELEDCRRECGGAYSVETEVAKLMLDNKTEQK